MRLLAAKNAARKAPGAARDECVRGWRLGRDLMRRCRTPPFVVFAVAHAVLASAVAWHQVRLLLLLLLLCVPIFPGWTFMICSNKQSVQRSFLFVSIIIV